MTASLVEWLMAPASHLTVVEGAVLVLGIVLALMPKGRPR